MKDLIVWIVCGIMFIAAIAAGVVIAGLMVSLAIIKIICDFISSLIADLDKWWGENHHKIDEYLDKKLEERGE